LKHDPMEARVVTNLKLKIADVEAARTHITKPTGKTKPPSIFTIPGFD
jgi:hypothetical protein